MTEEQVLSLSVGGRPIRQWMVPLRDENEFNSVCDALIRLGVDASAAIPSLASKLRRDSERYGPRTPVNDPAENGWAGFDAQMRNVRCGWVADALRAMGGAADVDVPSVCTLTAPHFHASIRASAAWLLGQCEDNAPSAVATLTLLLKDQDPGIRAIAANSLGRRAGAAESAIAHLAAALRDRSKLVREAAAAALAKIPARSPALSAATASDTPTGLEPMLPRPRKKRSKSDG